jgi:hypothetical protein
MADNVQLNLGSGGDALAARDESDVKYQRIIPVHGASGTVLDTSSANPFPTIDQRLAAMIAGNQLYFYSEASPAAGAGLTYAIQIQPTANNVYCRIIVETDQTAYFMIQNAANIVGSLSSVPNRHRAFPASADVKANAVTSQDGINLIDASVSSLHKNGIIELVLNRAESAYYGIEVANGAVDSVWTTVSMEFIVID